MQNQDVIEQQERERKNSQLRDSVAWFADDTAHQEDMLDRISQRRESGTCEWILNVTEFTTWLRKDEQQPLLWLKGKPGAGKGFSVITSRVILITVGREEYTMLKNHPVFAWKPGPNSSLLSL